MDVVTICSFFLYFLKLVKISKLIKMYIFFELCFSFKLLIKGIFSQNI